MKEPPKRSRMIVDVPVDSGKLKGWRVPGSKFRRVYRPDLVAFMRASGMPEALIPSMGNGGAK